MLLTFASSDNASARNGKGSKRVIYSATSYKLINRYCTRNARGSTKFYPSTSTTGAPKESLPVIFLSLDIHRGLFTFWLTVNG